MNMYPCISAYKENVLLKNSKKKVTGKHAISSRKRLSMQASKVKEWVLVTERRSGGKKSLLRTPKKERGNIKAVKDIQTKSQADNTITPAVNKDLITGIRVRRLFLYNEDATEIHQGFPSAKQEEFKLLRHAHVRQRGLKKVL